MSLERIEIAVKDLQRRMENILRPGKVIAVDPNKALVKVRFMDGDPAKGILPLDSDWLRVLQERAGGTIDWDFPEVGEQLLVLSPGGELGAGYAAHAIYSGSHPAPSNAPKVRMRRYADGLECSYDQDLHVLTISRPKDPEAATGSNSEPALKIIVKATSIDVTSEKVTFKAEKFAIKNSKGEEVLRRLSDAIKSVQKSKTATMMGAQPLLPAATELVQIATTIDSFGDSNAP
ncbi:MAG: phage baseplate assembly protein V [Pseudobdellovibrionaceae bacterium]|nr:phage baseplate assembly protein V [Pseudobdellovibrionaceae bacterium]